MNKKLFSILFAAMLATSPIAFADDLKIDVSSTDAVKTTLQALSGKSVTLTIGQSETIAGIVGGLMISLVAYGLGLISLSGLVICSIAAFVATNIESVIGATLQDKFDWLTNELVNAINTIIGAVVAISISILWH